MVLLIFNSSLIKISATLAVLSSVLIILVVFSISIQPVDGFHVSSLPNDTTNISHLVLGLVGSTKAWHYRKSYIESWWRPNATRGYLYLDNPPTNDLLPWSKHSPPFRVSDDLTKLLDETKHVAPIMVRMVHAVIEVFREEREGVRWYVMGDDNSLFFVDNMVDVLSKYDHNKHIYIEGHSEYTWSNQLFSYDMGFGGAGLIMSYPLAKMVYQNIEDCFRRYPNLTSADHILMTCVNDFGVSMTAHQGLHQLDIRGDVSGILSYHPKAPLLSLYHIDIIDPIFRCMDRCESAKHLMKAANIDQDRMVQQSICYNRQLSWSFAVSWGYSVHIYEKIIPRNILKIPLETFKPWHKNSKRPFFIFNTRKLPQDPCSTPHMFSFQ